MQVWRILDFSELRNLASALFMGKMVSKTKSPEANAVFSL